MRSEVGKGVPWHKYSGNALFEIFNSKQRKHSSDVKNPEPFQSCCISSLNVESAERSF